MPAGLDVQHRSALSLFSGTVHRAPASPLVHYLDTTLSVREVDELSDALACALADLGVTRGDRVALYLQNVPQFVLAMLGAWKAGAIVVPLNPMNKANELRTLLVDSGASVLVSLEALYHDVAVDVVDQTAVRTVITTSELEFVTDTQLPIFTKAVLVQRDTLDLLTLVGEYRGRTPRPVELTSSDVAFITYTSGTTGTPKGAMNTHGNVVFSAEAYRAWVGLDQSDCILGMAPLFHITGLVAHVALSFGTAAPLVLGCRFHAETMLRLIERYRPTFTMGSITALIALMNSPEFEKSDMSSLAVVYSGGQAVPSSIVEEFERRVGVYIRIAYGLTETTSPSHLVPMGQRAPVDPATGALSVGVPIFDTTATIVDDEGAAVPPGELGEIAIAGPQVVPGYWQNPEETAIALSQGMMLTGDIGFMDEQGWFYVVDRKKDLINTSGYKVWPREVEEVLNRHPCVKEVAVVGVPDAYRGETVKAFVSLRSGADVSTNELVDFCRQRLAAYKYPRQVVVIDELPKTASGKIVRRELRQ